MVTSEDDRSSLPQPTCSSRPCHSALGSGQPLGLPLPEGDSPKWQDVISKASGHLSLEAGCHALRKPKQPLGSPAWAGLRAPSLQHGSAPSPATGPHHHPC